MKVDGSLKSLIQGVSQQPARTRLPGQCTLQENMSSNPVDGLSRRPPLEWIDDLFTDASTIQWYNLKHGTDTYVVGAGVGSIRVFSLDGTEKTVNEVDDGFDYLDGEELAFTTIENQTFVANTEVVCAMETDLPTFVDHGPIVYVKGGTFSTIYTITVRWKDAGPGGTARSATVTHTTDATDVTTVRTSAIAAALKAALDASTTDSFNSLFDVTRQEDVLYIQWKTATTRTDFFTAAASDSAGNQNLIACNNDVKLVSSLPRFAPHGYFVTVTGDGSQKEDNYYLEFSVTPDDQGVSPALGAGFGQPGIWIETVKTGIPYLLNRDTMPHVLTYQEDTDDFDFGPGEWGDRIVGDEDSNPDPSLIGKPITWLSYFQGRLVLLSGPATLMSRTNEPLELWIESSVLTKDTDPIDIESTAEGVTTMRKAIPHNRDLVIFADGAAQFIILGRNLLTPENAAMVLTTAFEANLNTAPVPAGRNIFFGINYGNYTGIREFFVSSDTDTNDSRPITQHVLKYIDGEIRHMASTSNFDTLLVQAGSSTSIYVYEYIWVGDQKVQSSWSTWIFPDDVHYFFFVESIIYFISKIGNDYVLEKLDLDTQFDTELEYQVKLDRKVYIESVDTEVADPIPHKDDLDDVIFVQGEGCPYPGMRAIVKTFTEGTNTVEFTTDMDGGTVIAGLTYTSRYRPTMPVVKDQDGVKVGTGKLKVSKFFINTQDTGSMEAKVVSKYRTTIDLHFSGRVVGNPDSLIGVPAITDSVFTVPYRDNSDHGEIELWTASHTPLTILDIEWVGQYTKRGQRITQGG